jgi:hypothetical protein
LKRSLIEHIYDTFTSIFFSGLKWNCGQGEACGGIVEFMPDISKENYDMVKTDISDCTDIN